MVLSSPTLALPLPLPITESPSIYLALFSVAVFAGVPVPYGVWAAALRACQVNKQSSHMTSSTVSSV